MKKIILKYLAFVVGIYAAYPLVISLTAFPVFSILEFLIGDSDNRTRWAVMTFYQFFLVPSAILLSGTWILGVWRHDNPPLVGELFFVTGFFYFATSFYYNNFLWCLFDSRCSVWE